MGPIRSVVKDHGLRPKFNHILRLLSSCRDGERVAAMAMMQWCAAVARRAMGAQRPALSLPPARSAVGMMRAPVLCGRGDKRTKKGKRFKGSYGNARPKKEKKIERVKDKVEVPRSTPWPLPFKLI